MLAGGCAHSPKVIDESPSMLTIRADYLEANPEGRYNKYIKNGEVTQGMNYVEVLAAWGVPHARYRTEAGPNEVEYWHYLAEDEVSHDWTQYTFVFEKRALAEWDVTRHNSQAGSLSPWSIDDAPIYPRIESETRCSRTVFVKK